MFTGIVAEVGGVISITPRDLTVAAGKIMPGIELGGSIAVNGACLTVKSFTGKSFSVDVMPETRQKTNLGRLRPGDKVNLERPLGLGGELGGHLVQGHVDGTGRITGVTPVEGATLVQIQAPPDIMRYIVNKGFIAVDGVSLTVTEKTEDAFGVSIVEFTRRNTILAEKKVGDVVNLEADIIGKYVAELMKPQKAGLTEEFLNNHGFLSG